ncbi:MAG: ABC transporter permease subunit [Desulfobacteraceae bacterium]|jgi:ABC-type transport system involved in multi-copper enzyme maturation permease subunit
MIKILIEKELKSILLSPKFIAVFSVCSILILLSIYIGIQDYRAAMAHYETVTAQGEQQMQDETSWQALRPGVTRYPNPMQIFVSGIQNDIGRQATISSYGTVKLNNSNYSENIIFAVFRSMDLMFIVQIVLSLFAILFTYDAINGERETGTLKLNFANPIPRTSYIVAKFIGSWLGLVIPLLIPVLLGIALVLLCKIPITASYWQQLGMFIGLSILYFSFFICLGVLVSSMTRQSAGSFLYLLVIWVSIVLIIPRAGVMIAGQFVPVPTAAEISSKLSQKRNEFYEQYRKKMDEENEKQDKAYENLYRDMSLTKEEKQKRSKELSDQYRTKIDEEQGKYQQKVAVYDATLNEDWRNRKAVREKLGFSLSRISPASAYQLAAMDLAETGMSLKTNYEDQIRAYSDVFNKFRSKKNAETDNSFNLMSDKKPEPLDLSEMPKFRYINPDLGKILQFTVIDTAILSGYIILIIAGTFIAFIRYDVR